MKRLALFALLVLATFHCAFATSVARIANGDCAGLTAAATSSPGHEPTLIVLANRGSYGYCPLAITGNITIDGAGAKIGLIYSNTQRAIRVSSGATLRITNLNFVGAGNPMSDVRRNCAFFITCPEFEFPLIENDGTLILDSVSAANVVYGSDAFIHNFGRLSLRNVTFANNMSDWGLPVLLIDGASSTAEIENSTFLQDPQIFGFKTTPSPKQLNISNSVIASPYQNTPICSGGFYPVLITSGGGNLITDGSCRLSGPNDRVVADAGLTDFGDHGGVVGTLALAHYSPAIGAGLAANCEATDARGVARGQSKCDAGAYEFGGGQGELNAAGISGLYYDAAHDGHYVSVQRLDGGNSLVIWNTFDRVGTPAWLFGVGTQSGSMIHVGQVYETLGGKLQPGGSVVGATPSLWGSFDFSATDCYAGTLNYQSAQPLFGSGQVPLQRLAFVNGLDCSP